MEQFCTLVRLPNAENRDLICKKLLTLGPVSDIFSFRSERFRFSRGEGGASNRYVAVNNHRGRRLAPFKNVETDRFPIWLVRGSRHCPRARGRFPAHLLRANQSAILCARITKRFASQIIGPNPAADPPASQKILTGPSAAEYMKED